MPLINLWLPAVSVALLAVLLVPRVRDNAFWRATVTPLASIIGSGFLIAAPLLGLIAGKLAPWVMLGVIAFAYLIGAIVRFNIRNLEPVLEGPAPVRGLRLIERVSEIALFGAYVVSVAFYLRLMSAFVLDGFGHHDPFAAQIMTTVVLVGIGGIGWRRGLEALERLEEYSVSVKLAIIAALIVGLLQYDMSNGIGIDGLHPESRPLIETVRMVAGLLLITQGFETSRYLSAVYEPELRIRSMRLAQWISGLIYIGFAILIAPLLPQLSPGHLDETAIIHLSDIVAVVLPVMLIIAAVMSQFSAAIADTLGAGGVVREQSGDRLTPGVGYLVATGCAVALVWSANVFEIVAYASRAFAVYYLSQTVLALGYAVTALEGRRRWVVSGGLAVMAVLLAGIAIFAIPAE